MEANLDGTHLIIRDTEGTLDTSLANAIRRSVMKLSYCVSFPPEMSDEQKEDYNKHLGTNFKLGERTFSVSQANFDHLQKLSRRMFRVPLFLDAETLDAFSSKLYFLLADRIPETGTVTWNAPMVYKGDAPLKLYSRDLIVAELRDGSLQEVEQELKEQIFKLNVHLITLNKGDHIYFVSTAEGGYGDMESAWCPCPFRYRFIETSGPSPSPSPTPVTSATSIQKEQAWTRRDGFGNPMGVEIAFQENGRKDVKMAVDDGLKYLINQLLGFKSEYLRDDSTVVKKDASVADSQLIRIFEGTVKFDTAEGTEEVKFLADYTLANLLASHILYDVTQICSEIAGDDMTLLAKFTERTLISYRKPHPYPRIMEVHVTLQIPKDPRVLEKIGVDTINDAYKQLIERAVKKLTEIIQEVRKIAADAKEGLN